jgi:uncharacterized membrane protein
MKTIKILSVLLVLAGMPFFAMAHEGHGVLEGHTLGHYVFNPMHAIPVVAVVLVVAIVLYRRRQIAKK